MTVDHWSLNAINKTIQATQDTWLKATTAKSYQVRECEQEEAKQEEMSVHFDQNSVFFLSVARFSKTTSFHGRNLEIRWDSRSNPQPHSNYHRGHRTIVYPVRFETFACHAPGLPICFLCCFDQLFMGSCLVMSEAFVCAT